MRRYAGRAPKPEFLANHAPLYLVGQ
jgi:hypothetical protein